jgi:HK97 family phage major capsid protein
MEPNRRKIELRWLWEVPEDADWQDEANWFLANPGLGTRDDIDAGRAFLDIQALREEFRIAQATPSYENTFRRLSCSQWVSQETRWLPMDKWRQCGAPFDPESLRGRQCFAGMDLSSTTDLSALVLTFPDDDGGITVLPFFWIPQERMEERSRRDGVPYMAWCRQGLVEATPGNVIDYAYIRAKVNDLAEQYQITEIAYDPHNAVQLAVELTGDGFEMLSLRQGFLSLSPPSKELERLVLSNKIRHGGNKVLEWMAENVMVLSDPAGNIKPDKSRNKDRIDGILIPTPLSARVLDRARNLAAVMRAGAVTVPMSTATLKLARLTTDPTAAWTAEAGAIAASDAVFDSVTFTARKLAALLVINNELLDDSDPSIDSVIEQAVAQAIAQKIDYTALLGSGTPPEPAGIVNQSNILTETAVGTPADFDKFLSALYKVKAANFEPNAVIYAPRTAQKLATLKTGLTGDKTPLAMPADWAAISKFTTNQVPINAGTGAQSYGFVAQWDQLGIGLRKNITIEVAREGAYDISGTVYSAFQKDQTLIRAIVRCDVQLFHPAAFCLMSAIDA